MKISLYYHTLKYLKFSQIFHRVLRRFISPKIRDINAPLAPKRGIWLPHPIYEQMLFADHKVRFLNIDGIINTPAKWDSIENTILWRYNLHYFDDLSAKDSDKRLAIQISFINRWIDENTSVNGVGWAPYPTSLRIVNWVKYFISYPKLLTPKISQSLAQQVDFLSQNLEKHLRGNHLLENAKSLIFAGLFFNGPNADKWLKVGTQIFAVEMTEQTLDDGGNFELTPMYHAIILTGFLDTINLFNAYPDNVDIHLKDKLKSNIIKMLNWLNAMNHQDGKISFFNDATFKIAPENEIIFKYATKLGFALKKTTSQTINLTNLSASGYVIVNTADYKLIADLGDIGPDYLPAHGHADVLSFELSINGQRIFVNSGISQYGLSAQRLTERKTAAHNCVTIDDLDTSHVWSGFRVAQRSSILNKKVEKIIDSKVVFSASHNGYKVQKNKAIHTREWTCDIDSITIFDNLNGSFNSAIAHFHIHPDVKISQINENSISLSTDELEIELIIPNAKISVEDCFWYNGFNDKLANKKILVKFITNNISSTIEWKNKNHQNLSD